MNRGNLLEIVLDYLANYGWTEGLNHVQVKQLIAPTKYTLLMTNLKKHLDQKGSSQSVTYSPLTLSTVVEKSTITTNNSQIESNDTTPITEQSRSETSALFYVPPQTSTIPKTVTQSAYTGNTTIFSLLKIPIPELRTGPIRSGRDVEGMTQRIHRGIVNFTTVCNFQNYLETSRIPESKIAHDF